MNLARIVGLPDKLITDPAYQRILELRHEISSLQLQNFLQDDIHKWTWWVSLAAGIIPLIIWWKFTDRRRFLEVTLYGALILTMSTFFDVAGYTMNLWDYPDKLLPFLPALPIDYIVIPVTFLLVYQRYRPWLDFIIASAVVSAFFAFIMEPVVSWLNLAVYLNWKYAYSFPIYVIMAALARWFITAFKARQT